MSILFVWWYLIASWRVSNFGMMKQAPAGEQYATLDSSVCYRIFSEVFLKLLFVRPFWKADRSLFLLATDNLGVLSINVHPLSFFTYSISLLKQCSFLNAMVNCNIRKECDKILATRNSLLLQMHPWVPQDSYIISRKRSLKMPLMMLVLIWCLNILVRIFCTYD